MADDIWHKSHELVTSVNLLPTGRCDSNSKNIISKRIIIMVAWPQNFISAKSRY